MDGVRCLMHRTDLTDRMVSAPGRTIVTAEHGVLEVTGGDGRVLRILEIQPAGKRTMTARDFLAGRRVAPGARLSTA